MKTTEDAQRIITAISDPLTVLGCQNLNQMWPAFEKMASEGASVVFKIDGNRPEVSGVVNRYTIVISGGSLGDDFFRKDSPTMGEIACEAVIFYNDRVWKK